VGDNPEALAVIGVRVKLGLTFLKLCWEEKWQIQEISNMSESFYLPPLGCMPLARILKGLHRF